MSPVDCTSQKEGLGIGLYLLGQCHEFGRGVSVDISAAKCYYTQAVEVCQHAEAMWRIGIILHRHEAKDAESLRWFHMAAEKVHHSDSQYYIGLFHFKGLGGLEENMTAAQKYLAKASNQGHSQATLLLAHIVWNYRHKYIYGYELYLSAAHSKLPEAMRALGHLSHNGFTHRGITIVKQDYKHALGYYCEAAQLGDSVSALMVGNYFEEGYLEEELGKDYNKALQWYETAYFLKCESLASLAIGKLKHLIASTLIHPEEIESMREEAFAWFEKVTEDGTEDTLVFNAKVMIALYHLNGWGRQKLNTELGFQILLDVAQSGASEAFTAVAKCYESGLGVEMSMSKALDYWEMAADMDNTEALSRIAEIYEFGLAGIVNREMAHNYYFKAKSLELTRNKKKISVDEYSFQSFSSSSSFLAIKTL